MKVELEQSLKMVPSATCFIASLGKQIQKDGKLITNTYDKIEQDLFVNFRHVEDEDVQSGWIYVLKTKSTKKELAGIKDLYKIGFARVQLTTESRIQKTKRLICLQTSRK
ncbi:MAG: hypothetical protein R2766_08655 [Saprospiraceae bacterium]